MVLLAPRKGAMLLARGVEYEDCLLLVPEAVADGGELARGGEEGDGGMELLPFVVGYEPAVMKLEGRGRCSSTSTPCSFFGLTQRIMITVITQISFSCEIARQPSF